MAEQTRMDDLIPMEVTDLEGGAAVILVHKTSGCDISGQVAVAAKNYHLDKFVRPSTRQTQNQGR